jgi:hypothetical protein
VGPRAVGEVKNSELLPGLEPPIIQLVAQLFTTELTRLINVLIEIFSSYLNVTLINSHI